MRILVTGAAGFIGFHLAQRLLERGDTVVGLDNLNAYYDVRAEGGARSQLPAQPPKASSSSRADIADRARDGGRLRARAASTRS